MLKRVQLNRWVLEETLEYLNQLAITRGYKQGSMMDKVIEEYRNPTVSYLMEQLITKLPLETYFTSLEKKQLSQLAQLIGNIINAKTD